MSVVSLGPSPARRDALARRIRFLVAATITYNVIEAIVAITAGTIASSTALVRGAERRTGNGGKDAAL